MVVHVLTLGSLFCLSFPCDLRCALHSLYLLQCSSISLASLALPNGAPPTTSQSLPKESSPLTNMASGHSPPKPPAPPPLQSLHPSPPATRKVATVVAQPAVEPARLSPEVSPVLWQLSLAQRHLQMCTSENACHHTLFCWLIEMDIHGSAGPSSLKRQKHVFCLCLVYACVC